MGEVLTKLALELNFVEPGKDAGLLPINSFIAEMEGFLQGQSAPVEIAQALRQARQWIDKLFDTTAVFDPVTIALLGDWQGWVASALPSWQNQHPCPALPPAWSSKDVGSITATASSGGDANPPSTSSPVAMETVAEPEPVLTLSLDADGELLREFINESQEHLQNIENGVLVLEENPADADTLNTIFRAFHTFKGGSGFLNLTPIKNLAHELESLLDAARQHKLAINSGIIDVILQGGDTLKLFVTQIGSQLSGTTARQPITVPTLQLIWRVRAILASPANPCESGQSLRVRPILASPANPCESGRCSGDFRRASGRPRRRRECKGCAGTASGSRVSDAHRQAQGRRRTCARRGNDFRFCQSGHGQARQPH